jgi:hypothetical protein
MHSAGLRRWEAIASARQPRTRLLLPMAIGAAVAAWIYFSVDISAAAARWLVCSVVGFAFIFLRAPSHFVWRSDATLLTRLPISGLALFDSGLRRTCRDAVYVAIALAISAAPLIVQSIDFSLPYMAMTASLLISGIGLGSATVVAAGTFVASERSRALLATHGGQLPAPPTAILGGLPGFVAALVIIVVIASAGSLNGGSSEIPWHFAAASLAALSAAGCVAARLLWSIHMPAILRDVTTLDRVQLAKLEILPIGRMTQLAKRLLPSRAARLLDKDARLMSRRFPMAGVVGFVVAVILVALAIWPRSDSSWMIVVVIVATAYAVDLQRRLRRFPVAVPRLESALGFDGKTHRIANLAWICQWWLSFVAVPALVAALRSPTMMANVVVITVTTIVMLLIGQTFHTPDMRSRS